MSIQTLLSLEDLIRSDEIEFYAYLEYKNLINLSVNCPKCCVKLSFRENVERLSCYRRIRGKKCTYSNSVRKNSMFEQSQLSIATILRLIYYYIAMNLPLNEIMHQLDIAPHTCVQWANFCREVILYDVKVRAEKIGGVGKVVEIGENSHGKSKDKKEQWVFGGAERNSDKVFMVTVQTRSKETLMTLIEENILPGTVIVGDCWKNYDCLEDEEFHDFTVHQSLIFKDPKNIADTNTFKAVWCWTKKGLPSTNYKNDQLIGHLTKHLWSRKRPKSNLFEDFLEAAAKFYSSFTLSKQSYFAVNICGLSESLE